MSPNRSRDELLGEVVRRGERLRRRQRLLTALGGSITVLLVVAGVAAAIGIGPGDDRGQQLAAGGRGATTTLDRLSPATGGATFALDAPPTTTPSDASQPATTPTTKPAPDAAIPDEPVATTTVPATPAPTAVAEETPACGPEHLTATAAAEKSLYGPGEIVEVNSSVRNSSAVTCEWVSYTISLSVNDGAGNPTGVSSSQIADAFQPTPIVPGEVIPGGGSWLPQLCTVDGACTPAPPGNYTAVLTWHFSGDPITVSAPFSVS